MLQDAEIRGDYVKGSIRHQRQAQERSANHPEQLRPSGIDVKANENAACCFILWRVWPH